jgi:hypothetical protein
MSPKSFGFFRSKKRITTDDAVEKGLREMVRFLEHHVDEDQGNIHLNAGDRLRLMHQIVDILDKTRVLATGRQTDNYDDRVHFLRSMYKALDSHNSQVQLVPAIYNYNVRTTPNDNHLIISKADANRNHSKSVLTGIVEALAPVSPTEAETPVHKGFSPK